MLKIFLTTPPIEKVVEPIYDKPGFIRTSLATLLGILRKDDRLKLGYSDAKFEQKNHASLLAEIVNFEPDLLGISAFTYEIIAAGELAGEVKKRFPDCLVLIGGSHVTALPAQTLIEFPSFDVAVVGEAEHSLPEICEAISLHRDWKQIKGIAYRSTSGDIQCTPTREKIQDLDQFPMPAWDLFPAASEYFIQSSRGCPYN
ncbi:MAG: cobalamin-dependent protein, partial [Bacteroidota bacterium]